MRKLDEPCDYYFGNMCTGFGNHEQICEFCGWGYWDHPEQKKWTEEFLNGRL